MTFPELPPHIKAMRQAMAEALFRPPPTPEQRDAYRARHARAVEKARERVQPTLAHWTNLVQVLPEPLASIARTHEPHWYTDTSTRLHCLGCDQGCSCDSPEWPCTTAQIILDATTEEPR